jgi:hypothetical protein
MNEKQIYKNGTLLGIEKSEIDYILKNNITSYCKKNNALNNTQDFYKGGTHYGTISIGDIIN